MCKYFRVQPTLLLIIFIETPNDSGSLGVTALKALSKVSFTMQLAVVAFFFQSQQGCLYRRYDLTQNKQIKTKIG